MSNPIIIGIDHGYAAMKTAHCSFPTGLVAYTHEPYSSDHVLEYDGQFYVIGSGQQALQKDKTATEDYYLLTLAAIAMELEVRKLPGEAEVILAAGLPLTSFGRDKKAFRQYLLRDSKPIDFRYEGCPYRITIPPGVFRCDLAAGAVGTAFGNRGGHRRMDSGSDGGGQSGAECSYLPKSGAWCNPVPE